MSRSQLETIVASPATALIVARAASRDPEISHALTDYLKRMRMSDIGDLRGPDFDALEEDSGLTTELCSLISVAITVDDVLPLAGGPAIHLDAVRALDALRSEGVEAGAVGDTLATQLAFPIGHPRAQVVYAPNPALPSTYYPLSDFHRLVFEHKFSELIGLLASLGATRIDVESEMGWTIDFASRLNLVLPFRNLSGEGSLNRQSSSRLHYVATYRQTHPPTIPPGLAWYQNEPLWRRVAEDRVRHGLDAFNLTLEYLDDFGVTLRLIGKVDALNADGNASFQKHERTIWRVSGDFGGS